ncbi:hypothetical protein PE067_16040 [Paracoccus sp. DMF-8]|uniref:hypothetical protein n=1 Tax=Paracoccus sp. DMF-8 TaxID=3019445 RepID=UPI0023E4635D|nr:hypothetical protein [Paracoccus sp. DMF-8]MDF3607518.1 hypothetical protein [Paracoccus sp. DMF-8]
MDYHRGSLTIDTDDVLIDGVDAEYVVDAVWSRRNSRNLRSVDHVHSVTLMWWGKSRYSRAVAVSIAGETAIKAEEQRAYEEWIATAVMDDANAYADYRMDMAAE